MHDDDSRLELRGRARAERGSRAPVSAVNLDSVESVSIGLLVERIGRLSDECMRQICAALDVAVDCQR